MRQQVEISCSTCKALCCRFEVPLIDDADEAVPQEFVEQPFGSYPIMKKGDDGWCICLDRKTMLCTIYPIRPFLCRDYQVGDYDCLEERKKLAQNLPIP